jgi:hypothetical protein
MVDLDVKIFILKNKAQAQFSLAGPHVGSSFNGQGTSIACQPNNTWPLSSSCFFFFFFYNFSF